MSCDLLGWDQRKKHAAFRSFGAIPANARKLAAAIICKHDSLHHYLEKLVRKGGAILLGPEGCFAAAVLPVK